MSMSFIGNPPPPKKGTISGYPSNMSTVKVPPAPPKSPPPKLYSGPMIDPKTGKSLIKTPPPPPKPPKVPPKVPPKSPAKTPVATKPPVTVPPVVTVEPEPSSSGSSPTPPPPPPVKSAPIDTVVFGDEAFSQEFLVDVLFEDVAGQELLSIARNDTVNGQDVLYQPIKNLNVLQETYNPTNLLSLYETSATYFSNFVIDIRSKIPSIGNGANGSNYYLDPATGDLIIEFVNILSDEQVEVQITTNGTIEGLGI